MSTRSHGITWEVQGTLPGEEKTKLRPGGQLRGGNSLGRVRRRCCEELIVVKAGIDKEMFFLLHSPEL